MACADVRTALATFNDCVETAEGSRVTTHCLYPSFDPVQVFIVKIGDGFRVHDSGGAMRSAWLHGRDASQIRKVLTRQAERYRVSVVEDALVADAVSADWLPSAILAVANASAATAHRVLDRVVSATERMLREKILVVLQRTVRPSDIAAEYAAAGESGKLHRFDFAVTEPQGSLLLINAVAPHHISVSAKYVAFADMLHRPGKQIDRFAVHEKPLDKGDVSLLQQVADIVPFRSLHAGVERTMLARSRP
jgi:hypothetical protein